jgi:hypothetical protein
VAETAALRTHSMLPNRREKSDNSRSVTRFQHAKRAWETCQGQVIETERIIDFYASNDFSKLQIDPKYNRLSSGYLFFILSSVSLPFSKSSSL